MDFASNFAVQIELGLEELKHARQHQTRERYEWMVDNYMPEVHDPLFKRSGWMMNAWVFLNLGYRVLALYGDIDLAKKYMRKHADVVKKLDLATDGPGFMLWRT